MAVLSWRVGRAIVPVSCLHRVDIVGRWDPTKTIVPYPNKDIEGFA